MGTNKLWGQEVYFYGRLVLYLLLGENCFTEIENELLKEGAVV